MRVYFVKNGEKKKPQFAKVWLVTCLIISVVCTGASYILAFLDKNNIADTVTISLNEILWGNCGVAFAGYALQNCVRAFTASKYGIPPEEMPTEQENNNGS